MEWESDEYPQFCYGPIYIMTPQIAYQLFQLFKQTLKQAEGQIERHTG